MLRELHISNLAVIEDARIELAEGFNCFTGQTGAGKSLIIGAFEILLGLRPAQASEMIRPGADEGRVSGIFELTDQTLISQVGQTLDMTLDPADPLLITRKLFASGRSSVSVNGQPVTAGMVKAVGELLVDIHGQHDHQFLLKPANQLAILDAFAGAMDLRQEFSTWHRALGELTRRRQELSASSTLRRQQLELYEFQAQEIDAANPLVGEFPELRARHQLLSNLRRVQRDAAQVHSALYDSEGAICERLQAMVHVLGDLAQLDPELNELYEQVRSATLTLQESAFELSRYTDRLDLDPRELGEVEERLNTLNRLASKYGSMGGDDPVSAVLEFRQQLQGQIDELQGQNEDLRGIDTQIEDARRQRQAVGKKLSAARQVAAKKLVPAINSQFKDLGMSEARLEVEFSTLADGSGSGEGANSDAGASGLEAMELLIGTNPGQPARPLRKIASGGELSRVMLALKGVLAASDRISVLVFDEIDANIGGRLGTVIGQKLRDLSRTGDARQQVLCITHLPQIAAFADRHLRIAKQVEGSGGKRQTRTTVTALDGKARVDELAEMLAGKDVTATTRKQVRELLDAAG
jgi:DNA repair protein RecN (Recombination protein N)